MQEQRYRNPPITEAIIDIRVLPSDGLETASLQGCQEAERERYPEARESKVMHGEFEAGDRLESSVSSEKAGYLFLSPDRRRIFQAKREGFTYNQLGGYPGWSVIRAEAQRLWGAYREKVSPKAVTRLAVRFINRLDIPAPSSEIPRYLRMSPPIPPALGGSPQGLFMQVRIPQPEIAGVLIVNHVILPPAREGVVSVALDIDLFRDAAVPQEENAIWEGFEGLRHRKNMVFESLITDDARELFS